MPKLVTLDLETIPDPDLASRLTGFDGDEFTGKVEAMRQYALSRTSGESDMLPPGLNKIVVAGMHLAEIRSTDNVGEWYETEYLSSTSEPEEGIVTKFITYLSKMMPRIVTYNGRSFDMAVLFQRALKYHISMPWFFDTSVSRYDNYTNRYSTLYHFDVLDYLCQFGATSRLKLRDVQALLRLPAKVYNGGNVLSMVIAGELAHVEEYCQMDCLNTFLAYCHCQFLRGAISAVGFDFSIRSALAFLIKHSDQAYLAAYLNEWTSIDPVVAREHELLSRQK